MRSLAIERKTYVINQKIMLPTQDHLKVPKYYRLAAELRAQIENGVLQPGTRLPSVSEMQEMHGVSLSTVDKAHSMLQKEGLIVREQGRGTFVAPPSNLRVTKTLGLILHKGSLTDFYMMDLLAGVRSEVTRLGLELLWLNDEDVISGKAVDAILMCCHPSEAIALSVPSEVPHALLFQHTPDFACISADDFAGVKTATQHLLEMGHRRITCLFSSDEDSISRQRLAGYRAALEEAGLQPDNRMVRFLLDHTRHGYRKSGELTMGDWIPQGWRDLGSTAILAHNDHAAIGIMKALSDNGMKVPDDVSVVGFDGTELSDLATPPLTTVKVPLREIGASAVKALAAQMEQGITTKPQNIVLPVQFQTGGSTKAIKVTNK
jgi:GntR family transcriptional regulator of arabinose operon